MSSSKISIKRIIMYGALAGLAIVGVLYFTGRLRYKELYDVQSCPDGSKCVGGECTKYNDGNGYYCLNQNTLACYGYGSGSDVGCQGKLTCDYDPNNPLDSICVDD